MDTRSPDVKPKPEPKPKEPSASDRAALEAAEARWELADLLGEIERRYRVWTDVRGQLAAHVVPIAIAGGAVLLLAGGGIAWAAIAARERNRPAAKARNLREALTRMTRKPERVAVKPTVLQSVASKALSAAVSALLAQAVKAAFKSVEQSPRTRKKTVVVEVERRPTLH